MPQNNVMKTQKARRQAPAGTRLVQAAAGRPE